MRVRQHITDLPAPDADARRHSEALRARIAAEIAEAGGAIPFERYMELALYAPRLGYYSAGAQKFGAAGDFVTAPEAAPVFARVVARQCGEILDAAGGDTILELGGGSGTLAAGVLNEFARLGRTPPRYLVLEPSPDLRARQREHLKQSLPAEVFARVEWLDRLPQPFAGVIVANEVLDALPVARFEATADGVREMSVGIEGDAFAWRSMPPRAMLSDAVSRLEAALDAPFAVGYQSEVNLNLAAFVHGLGDCITRGALLFIDYGMPQHTFYLPERDMGTLMCHYRHRAHADPFLYPGLQDITAHVDFTAVAEAGVAAGLELPGYTTQAYFLLGGGLEEIMCESDPAATRDHLELTRQIKLLTSPDEMGERFKAMLLARDIDAAPSGFALRDLSHQL